jgi:hypothetical protein
MKKCTKCGVEKPLSEYQKRNDAKDGFRNDCIECRNRYNSIRHRKIKYSVSEIDFNKILKNQSYTCIICSKELTSGNKTHLDHCHKTGKIRGILCNSCNLGLGLFKDSIQSLTKAIEYLSKYEKIEG